MCVCVSVHACRFGSDELKKEFLLPSIMGDMVACLGVSEVGAGSDVSSMSFYQLVMIFLSFKINSAPADCDILYEFIVIRF